MNNTMQIKILCRWEKAEYLATDFIIKVSVIFQMITNRNVLFVFLSIRIFYLDWFGKHVQSLIATTVSQIKQLMSNITLVPGESDGFVVNDFLFTWNLYHNGF